jgi:hypothetical protein
MTNPTSNPTPDPIMPGYQYRRGFRPFAVQETGVPAEGRQTSKAVFWSVVLGILPLVLGQLAPLALVVVPLAIVALTRCWPWSACPPPSWPSATSAGVPASARAWPGPASSSTGSGSR